MSVFLKEITQWQQISISEELGDARNIIFFLSWAFFVFSQDFYIHAEVIRASSFVSFIPLTFLYLKGPTANQFLLYCSFLFFQVWSTNAASSFAHRSSWCWLHSFLFQTWHHHTCNLKVKINQKNSPIQISWRHRCILFHINQKIKRLKDGSSVFGYKFILFQCCNLILS